MRPLNMASSRDDHHSLTTMPNGCLEREDVYGDALADIPNIVVFVNLSTTTPLIHCISWYDLRAVLEPPDVPPAERVRLWRSDQRVPSNYVYRVLDRWFDPSLEPFTRYYNTFLLYDSYEAPIGTMLAISALHGAAERLHRVRPIHRRDVIAYVKGELPANEFRARLAATVGGLPDAATTATAQPRTAVVFEPELEDAVRPAVLYEGDHIVLARPFEGKPFGHATVWRRGHLSTHATYDGSLAVGETNTPATVAVAVGDNRISAVEEVVPDEDADTVPRAVLDAALARVRARMAAQSATYQASVVTRMTFRIPGVRQPYIAEFDAAGNETESNVSVPFAREMMVEIDGASYRLRPRFGSEVVREGAYGEIEEIRDTLTLGEEPSFTGDPAHWASLTRLIESARRRDIARVRQEGTLVLRFLDGVEVYEYTNPDGNTEYVYTEGAQPSLYPPLAGGLWDVMLPDRGRGRVLLDPFDSPRYFSYDVAQCRFHAEREPPAIIMTLLAENPAADGPPARTYLFGDSGWYLLAAGVPCSLTTGTAAYPFNDERLEVWDDGIYWDYHYATRELRPQVALGQRVARPAPAELSALLQMLRSPTSFRIRYVGRSPVFHIRHADGYYYSSIIPPGTRRDRAFDATVTEVPPLFVRRYEVIHGRIATYVELPVTLPTTWEELAADIGARYPRIARPSAFMGLLRRQYDQYMRDGAPTADVRVREEAGTVYYIGVNDGVLRKHCPGA